MRYFGGKTRICKEIACLLEAIRKPHQTFMSVFVGGGWVEALVKDPKVCSDKHKYLIAMYKEIQNGWVPPKSLTKEEYAYVKNNKDEKPYLAGFVGFGCSFAGKWFGGYAKENSNRNFCLNAHNSLMRKMDGFRNTVFDCKDYSELNPNNMLIYCDPPYFGTTQYSRQVVGDFDYDKFWHTMRKWSLNNTVVISEYVAPEDFKCIWKKVSKLDICDKNNKKLDTVEKVFTKNESVFSRGHLGHLFE